MKKTFKKTKKKLSADDIAGMADQGKKVSKFFTNSGTMKFLLVQSNKSSIHHLMHEKFTIDCLVN